MIQNTALQFHRFDRLDSTNGKAKTLAVSGAPHGTVVVAAEQTCGRGRLGRSFFSPKGSGVYLSMILRPEEMGLSGDSAILLTTAASVAVARAVKKTLDLDLQIKWVNDLYFKERKVCGILAEGIIDPHHGVLSAVVLGIGLNYREPIGGFPEELNDIAGALLPADSESFSTEDASFSETPLPSADQLASAVAQELWCMLPTLSDRSFLTEYKERSMVLRKRVRIFPKSGCPDQFRLGTALDIADDGGLVVQYDDGTTETLTTGEISLRIV